MKVIIQSVNVEHVAKGKTGYDVATISYTFNGETKQTKILSFVQPSLFAKTKELNIGESYDVTLEQDGKYMRWATWSKADGYDAPTKVATVPTKGNWETPEERAYKQVLIVRQSSLAQAVAHYGKPWVDQQDVDDVLRIAQQFTEWVLQDANQPTQD